MNYSKKSTWQVTKSITQSKLEEKIFKEFSRNKRKAENQQYLEKEMTKKVKKNLWEEKETE